MTKQKVAACLPGAGAQKNIPQIMRACRGGHDNTPDNVLIAMFNGLDEQVQTRYRKSYTCMETKSKKAKSKNIETPSGDAE